MRYNRFYNADQGAPAGGAATAPQTPVPLFSMNVTRKEQQQPDFKATTRQAEAIRLLTQAEADPSFDLRGAAAAAEQRIATTTPAAPAPTQTPVQDTEPKAEVPTFGRDIPVPGQKPTQAQPAATPVAVPVDTPPEIPDAKLDELFGLAPAAKPAASGDAVWQAVLATGDPVQIQEYLDYKNAKTQRQQPVAEAPAAPVPATPAAKVPTAEELRAQFANEAFFKKAYGSVLELSDLGLVPRGTSSQKLPALLMQLAKGEFQPEVPGADADDSEVLRIDLRNTKRAMRLDQLRQSAAQEADRRLVEHERKVAREETDRLMAENKARQQAKAGSEDPFVDAFVSEINTIGIVDKATFKVQPGDPQYDEVSRMYSEVRKRAEEIARTVPETVTDIAILKMAIREKVKSYPLLYANLAKKYLPQSAKVVDNGAPVVSALSGSGPSAVPRSWAPASNQPSAGTVPPGFDPRKATPKERAEEAVRMLANGVG